MKSVSVQAFDSEARPQDSHLPKRLVITGASGFVGKQIVPRLAALGYDLLLVGRNPSNLTTQFPAIPCCGYDDLAERGRGYDILIHLAVLNNSSTAPSADFDRVNVDLLARVVDAAKHAGIPNFINVTSFHAIDESVSGYAESKRAALQLLRAERGLSVRNLFLPAVHGDDFSGKLGVVRKLPDPIQPYALNILSALAPTVHVDRIVDFMTGARPQHGDDVLLFSDQDRNPVFRAGKKLIDLVFATSVIVLAGWIMAIVWAIIKLGSPGPGIFAQERVGKNGIPFTCYKFRTMKTGTKQAGTHELTADAITGIGAFLRKTKIDELPQVINILKGELSLVGPRPGLPVQTDLTKARMKRNIYSVLPGITGLAQINGIDMRDPDRLAEIDAQYIARRGLVLDLKIIAATFLGRGQGDKISG